MRSKSKPPRRAAAYNTMAQFTGLALLPSGTLVAMLLVNGTFAGPVLDVVLANAALSALAGLGLGWQISRANGRRIEPILHAMRRLARQDYSLLVQEKGLDDISEVARTFNVMARNLGEARSVQEVLEAMDQAILSKAGLGALIRGALRCMRLVTRADVVIVGLFESDAAQSMRVFVMYKAERGQVHSEKLEISARLKQRIPMKPTSKTMPKSPFPEEFEVRLRKKGRIAHFHVMPITGDTRAWGIIVSCQAAASQLDLNQVKTLNGIASRLCAGLRSSETDEKMHALAYVDVLTGLPNRVALISLLSQALVDAQRSKSTGAVLYVDLDRFKEANETHGHAFGDLLLAQVATRIRNILREDDVVARMGGDEFVIILPGIKEPREAASVARKVIQVLARPFKINDSTVYSGASVGISFFPGDSLQGLELLKMADTAMARAKSAGRNRFALYEVPMNSESKRRTVLDCELRDAVRRKELVLHYQPQVDLKTGTLCSVEALVRWQHPTRGLLSPGDFIEYAEEIGLITQIGAWIMEEACRQFQQWRAEGVRVPRVSVNVSNGELPRSAFVSHVQQVIAKTAMPPGSLEIEVTQSMLAEGGGPAIRAIKQLARSGVRIAVDDFGTGYSSFAYLKTMPAKVIKLDMSIVAGARQDNDAGKIVAAIVNMAKALRKEVVAEGVETIDQLKLLKSLGCDRGQGYLFGKAVTADKIKSAYALRQPDELRSPATALVAAM